MKIKKKLTRKQFLKQEDEFISSSVKTLTWIKENYNKIIIGAIIFSVILIVVLSVRFNRKTNLVKSNKFLSMAKNTYYANVQPPSQDPNIPLPPQEFSSSEQKYKKAIELFEQLIQLYPKSDAAHESRFFIPNCLHFLGRYDEAIKGFNDYMNLYPDGDFAIQAMTGIGYAQKTKGDYGEAIATFQQILDNNPHFILSDALYMELGSCFEKTGSLDKAKDSYQHVVINFPDSPFLKGAQTKIDILEKKG